MLIPINLFVFENVLLIHRWPLKLVIESYCQPHVANLLIRHIYTTFFHGSQSFVLKFVRSKFWITNGDQRVTKYEQFETFCTQIEAILNSFPLYMKRSSSDFSAIIPAHFLVGDSLLSLPSVVILKETSAPPRDVNTYSNAKKLVCVVDVLCNEVTTNKKRSSPLSCLFCIESVKIS